MDRFKVKVFVNHKPIGWMRQVTVKVATLKEATENVVSPSLARATTFCDEAAGEAMAGFQGPDREADKKSLPVVTFQLCRV